MMGSTVRQVCRLKLERGVRDFIYFTVPKINPTLLQVILSCFKARGIKEN